MTSEVRKILSDVMSAESAEEIDRAWREEAAWRAGQLERGEVEARDGETVMRELLVKYRRQAQ